MPVLLAAAAVALTGCSGGVAYRGSPAAASAPAPAAAPPSSTSAAAPASASGGDVTVDIVNYKFQVTEVSVQVGSTVTWVNKDDFDHTATATDKKFDTKKLVKGAAGTVTFDTAGTFGYICDIHQYMTGTVVVT